VQAVAHQQLNGTAANTILTRFKKLFPGRKFPRPEDLAKVTDAQIRACGFSFAKIKAIRDIAEKTLSGVVPTSREIVKLSDDEIIRAADGSARRRALDGGDAFDFSAWPTRCFARG
jgi:DNA-3-methyladenine glycosylase II